MKSFKAAILLLMLLGPMTATVARADHGHFHGHVGVFIAPWPVYYPYSYYPYGYYPYAAYPSVVVTQPAAPTVYIEQGNSAAAQDGQQADNPTQGQPTTDWFYCRNPAGYYPYVRSCANGWQRVPAQPQAQPQPQN